jgi:peroxiredoxin
MNKLVASLLLLFVTLTAMAVDNGQKAPGFTLQDMNGKEVSLSGYTGKTVVLEWINPGCPFVRKFYNKQDMPRFQKAAVEMGVVWLSINSTNPGHGDYLSPEATRAWAASHGHAATWLLDPEGTAGKAYGARVTPHMFIINPEGVVVYQGAIDSVKDTKPESIPGATNHVMDALKAMAAGDPVPDANTRPYGCSVKY